MKILTQGTVQVKDVASFKSFTGIGDGRMIGPIGPLPLHPNTAGDLLVPLPLQPLDGALDQPIHGIGDAYDRGGSSHAEPSPDLGRDQRAHGLVLEDAHHAALRGDGVDAAEVVAEGLSPADDQASLVR